jgi:hypothetical protein
MEIKCSKKSHWIHSIFISICYLLLRRNFIINSGMDADEILSWNIAKSSWSELFYKVYHDTQQPLYYALLKISTFFSPSNNDYWIRFPTLIMGLCFILVFFNYFKKHFDQLTAVLITVVIFSHNELAYLSTYNRPHGMLLLLIAIHYFSTLEVCYKNNNSRLLRKIIYITSPLIFLTHYLAYFYFTAIIGALLITQKRKILKELILRHRLAISLFLLPFILCTFYQYKYISNLHWISPIEKTFSNSLDLTFNLLNSSNFSLFKIPHLFTLSIALLASLFFALFIFKKINSNDQDKPEISFHLSFLLTGLISFFIFSKFITPVFDRRYLLILLPSYYILLGHAFSFYNLQRKIDSAILIVFFLVYFQFQKTNPTISIFDGKYFLKEISEKKLLPPSATVYCNTYWVGPGVFTNYSLMYFPTDICTKYRYSIDNNIPLSSDYDYYVNNKFHEVKDVSFAEVILNYQLIYSSRDMELYKKKLTRDPPTSGQFSQ